MSTKLEKLQESLAKAEERSSKSLGTIEKYKSRNEKYIVELKQKYGIDISFIRSVDHTKQSEGKGRWALEKESTKALEVISRHYTAILRSDEVLEQERVRASEIYEILYKVRSNIEGSISSYAKYLENEVVVNNWKLKVTSLLAETDFSKSAHPSIIASMEKWAKHAYHLTLGEIAPYDEAKVRSLIEQDKVYKIVDLNKQLLDVIGTIQQGKYITVGWKGQLNGYFQGEKGVARVETIGAGGYNIQKWHLRTLIHKLKDRDSLIPFTEEEVYTRNQMDIDHIQATIKMLRKSFNTKIEGKTEEGVLFPDVKLQIKHKTQEEVYILAKQFVSGVLKLNPPPSNYTYKKEAYQERKDFEASVHSLGMQLRKINALYYIEAYAREELEKLRKR